MRGLLTGPTHPAFLHGQKSSCASPRMSYPFLCLEAPLFLLCTLWGLCQTREGLCNSSTQRESPFLFCTKDTVLGVALPNLIIIAVTETFKLLFQSAPIYIISFENYNNSVT